MALIADLSHYNNVLDWDKVASQLDFCILRATVGMKLDNKYSAYARACVERALPHHAYHYLKAKNEAEAVAEAKLFYETASAIKPLFYCVDVEEKSTLYGTPKLIVSAFLAELRRLGAKRVGLYVAHNRYKEYGLNLDEADYVWIPRYGANTGMPDKKPVYPCDLWQYTSTGKLDGVRGNVDLNALNSDKPLEFFIADCDEVPVQAVRNDNKTVGKTIEVTGGSVNIRSGAGTNYKIVSVAKKGDKLESLVADRDDGWVAIRVGDGVGWISGKYVK